ncbi:zinc ABC transporter substrate-binding protein [Micromonospora sp. FIMYZ51]|uniref:metal ABC transporter solute-binding protein, Zn/Mn family n=1 Tax=Micromonospora sp. FIMYZ51 TaxID=3051832 RepID=UPI00311DEC98
MRSIRAAALSAVVTLSLLASGCGSTDEPTPTGQGVPATPAADSTSVAPAVPGPTVVASTSWVGALAKAAGASEVTLVAPADVAHPSDYQPKARDLKAAADADYVLYAESDGFAPRLIKAAGDDSELVTVLPVEATTRTITTEVTRLATMFGTSDAAKAWLSTFNAEYTRLSRETKAALPNPAPTAVSELLVGYWGSFAGIEVTEVYGPQPLTAKERADLAAKQPKLVLINAHSPKVDPKISGATRVTLVNYPGKDLDLLAVFRTNAERLTTALTS